MSARARLRLVDTLHATALREVAIASYRAARLSASRGRGEALRLNHLSHAGLLLTLFPDPAEAARHVDGRDRFADQTTKYLRDVAESEGR